MKFVPKLCITGVLLLPALLLPACSSAPEPSRVADATVAMGEGSMPKPTQTTWSVPEPTSTESTKSDTGLSISTLAECAELDKATVYRFQKSGVKCPQLLELRARIVQEVGEQMADWALLAYHSEFCTENGDKLKGGELRPYDPSKKSHGEELLYKVKPGESNASNGDTADLKLGAFVPCREPAVTKQ